MLLVLLLVPVLLAACGSGAAASPRDMMCDGIDAKVGGCDADRPTFAGETCDAVGHEAGAVLNERLPPIYRGPEVADGESRAVRASQMMSLTVTLANLHLRKQGLIRQCGVDEFLRAAQEEFGADLKGAAGRYLYDGATVTYEQWLDELARFLKVIAMDEGDPSPTPS